jgi:hypothetical protein
MLPLLKHYTNYAFHALFRNKRLATCGMKFTINILKISIFFQVRLIINDCIVILVLKIKNEIKSCPNLC